MKASINPYFEDLGRPADLGRLARRGGVALVASVYGNGVLQIAGAIVLARLLTPEDFGLVAIVMVLTRFAPLLIDFGLGDALVQKARISHSQVSTLFWVSTAIGVAIAVGLAACSPLIAWLYRDPRLQSIAAAFAVTFIFTGLSSQHMALLRRAMEFVAIARIQLLSALAGFIAAILIAVSGHGYWALVARPVVSAVFVAAGTWLACSWRPGFPVFDPEAKPMLRFGIHILSFSIVAAVTWAMDRIAMGLVYLPSVIGYYQNALNMYENALMVPMAQLHNVGSAALSKLSSNAVAVHEKYQATLSALAFFVMPTAAIMSVTGEDVAVILLGQRWRQSGLLLSIIALGGIIGFVDQSQGWLHVSSGRADRWKNWGFVSFIVRAALILAALPFGAEGMAIAYVAAGWVLAFPAISYAGRPLGITAGLAFRAVRGPLLGATITCAAGWWLRASYFQDVTSLLRIALLTLVCASIYLLIVTGLLRIIEPIRVAGKLLQDFRTRLPGR